MVPCKLSLPITSIKSLCPAWRMGREKPRQELMEEGYACAHGLKDI